MNKINKNKVEPKTNVLYPSCEEITSTRPSGVQDIQVNESNCKLSKYANGRCCWEL